MRITFPTILENMLLSLLRPAILLIFWLAVSNAPLLANNEETSPRQQLDAVKKEREQISAQLAAVVPSDGVSSSSDPGLESNSEQLKKLDSVLAQHQAKLIELVDANQKAREAKLLLEKLDKFVPVEEKPYSFLALETLRDALEREELNEELFKSESKAAKLLVETAEDDRAEKEKIAKSARGLKSDSDANSLRKAEAELKLAKAKLELRKTELGLLQTRQELSASLQKQLNVKINAYEKGVKFSVDDRESIVSKLKKEQSTWLAQKREADSRIERLTALESRLKAAESTKPTSNLSEADAKLLAEAMDIYQTQGVFFSQVADSLSEAQSHWKSRFELQNSKPTNLKTLKEWKSSLDDLLERMDAYGLAIHRKSDSLRIHGDLSQSPDKEVAAANPEATQANEEAHRFMDVATAKMTQQFQATKLPLTRFRKELRDAISNLSTIWNTDPIELVKGMLSYEVAEVDDKGIPISRAIFLIVLIAVGIYLSFYASKFVGKYVFPLIGVKPGVAVALRSIFRYCLCIVFGVVAFKLMGIPLTAFAFLGGAAAIAVGFGSQDVMNNFMSGVILLTEQPIRVGDVILLSDNQCIVTHIGLRSTRLRNYQNHELIVPNTLLIEKLVTNLTLSDNLLRVVVPLVVDRTEAIGESMQRIIQAIKKESRVHQAMEPIVLLKEVDTYYLTFEVHFTIEFADPMESLIAQSNVLTVIGQLFPTKKEEESSPSESEDSSPSLPSDNAGKLTRNQLEKEIKKLQAVLVTKK